jgi:ribonucleoside-diphosphate reductase alpha chain
MQKTGKGTIIIGGNGGAGTHEDAGDGNGAGGKVISAPTPTYYCLSELQEMMGVQQAFFPLFQETVTDDVWQLKYKRRNELSISETLSRVAGAFEVSNGKDFSAALYCLMAMGVFFPAGRVIAGAGIDEHDSTLMNCYVMGTLPDSLDGIFDCLHESAKTQKYGGGIGVDFTPLRPKGAEVSTAAFFAGGSVAFMGLWDAMGHALECGGNRRGGKMATLADHHPDILEFIEAKSKRGMLTSFNVSVLISDKFMQAVENDEPWNLYHTSPKKGMIHRTFQDATGTWQCIWDTIPARELWDAIMKNTYLYSEPGVIFIDRVNEMNPLNYAEVIRCTNPCAEQPLPSYGACDLGQINLARLVTNPFLSNAGLNMRLLEYAVKMGVRTLDAVLDITKYPLHQQYKEAMNKRRIGLGITGLADMLTMLGLSYDSEQARSVVHNVMSHIEMWAYKASIELAQERGAFPLFSVAHHLETKFSKTLTKDMREQIREHGLRNSHMLSIAPTGTVSILFGDVSGGCEPHFLHKMKRKIKVKDENNNDVFKSYNSYSYAVRMYAHVYGIDPEKVYQEIHTGDEWCTADTILPDDHIAMQSVIQKYIDASISKTVNCPEDIPFNGFKSVYMHAFKTGCKGCATYRPSDVRDEILSAVKEPAAETEGEAAEAALTLDFADVVTIPEVITLTPDYKREGMLHGVTHKLRWPGLSSPVFVTINHLSDGKPVEVFISSKNDHYNEWAVAMSVMISKLLQAGVSANEVGDQLGEITLSHNGAFMDERHYGSIIAKIGELIKNHSSYSTPLFKVKALATPLRVVAAAAGNIAGRNSVSNTCTFCGSRNTQYKEGCLTCIDCHQSKCD